MFKQLVIVSSLLFWSVNCTAMSEPAPRTDAGMNHAQRRGTKRVQFSLATEPAEIARESEKARLLELQRNSLALFDQRHAAAARTLPNATFRPAPGSHFDAMFGRRAIDRYSRLSDRTVEPDCEQITRCLGMVGVCIAVGLFTYGQIHAPLSF